MTYRDYPRGLQRMLVCAFAVIIVTTDCWAGGVHNATIQKKQSAGGGVARGSVRYLAASKAFEIEIPPKNVKVRVQASDVDRITLLKQPDQLAPAVAAVKRGQFSAAIATLKKIKDDYDMFGPDLIAARYLAVAYLGMNQTAEAVRMCEDVLRSNPRATDDGEFAGVYWDALLKEKMHGKLLRILDDAIQTGAREVAAVALVKRGDIFMAKRETKKALLDGYLRTVLMFQDVKSIQPEALYKAVKAHEALNENNYAEKWRKRLLSSYGTSEYAKKLN